ncbi:MAG: hypothetical protein H7X99_02575 [Saprospiraceae bacterium]|nr:hypothetical protein [Saprospiraceae bacterium]
MKTLIDIDLKDIEFDTYKNMLKYLVLPDSNLSKTNGKINSGQAAIAGGLINVCASGARNFVNAAMFS